MSKPTFSLLSYARWCCPVLLGFWEATLPRCVVMYPHFVLTWSRRIPLTPAVLMGACSGRNAGWGVHRPCHWPTCIKYCRCLQFFRREFTPPRWYPRRDAHTHPINRQPPRPRAKSRIWRLKGQNGTVFFPWASACGPLVEPCLQWCR